MEPCTTLRGRIKGTATPLYAVALQRAVRKRGLTFRAPSNFQLRGLDGKPYECRSSIVKYWIRGPRVHRDW